MSGTTDLLGLLREATRPDHEAMEAVPALKRLMAPDLTATEYAAVLQHMYAFHSVLEPVIAVALRDHKALALVDGSRLSALAEDLAWFGMPPVRSGVAVPVLGSAAAAIGALYVVEGSGLGGRVIARHVQASLGVAPGRGGSFYGGLSADAARARWRAFCGVLAEPGGGGDDGEAIAGAARATFRCLGSLMSRAAGA
jgi:heme oxygenase